MAIDLTKPLVVLRAFFNLGAPKQVDLKEFAEFWAFCSDAEKEQFKRELSAWDGTSEFIH